MPTVSGGHFLTGCFLLAFLFVPKQRYDACLETWISTGKKLISKTAFSF
jgi:hypothetical protein